MAVGNRISTVEGRSKATDQEPSTSAEGTTIQPLSVYSAERFGTMAGKAEILATNIHKARVEEKATHVDLAEVNETLTAEANN